MKITKAHLNRLIYEATSRGIEQGRRNGEEVERKKQAEFYATRAKEAHLKLVEAVANAITSLGHIIGETGVPR